MVNLLAACVCTALVLLSAPQRQVWPEVGLVLTVRIAGVTEGDLVTLRRNGWYAGGWTITRSPEVCEIPQAPSTVWTCRLPIWVGGRYEVGVERPGQPAMWLTEAQVTCEGPCVEGGAGGLDTTCCPEYLLP